MLRVIHCSRQWGYSTEQNEKSLCLHISSLQEISYCGSFKDSWLKRYKTKDIWSLLDLSWVKFPSTYHRFLLVFCPFSFSILKLFGKIYITWIYHLNSFLNGHFSGQYILMVVQPISRTLHLAKQNFACFESILFLYTL